MPLYFVKSASFSFSHSLHATLGRLSNEGAQNGLMSQAGPTSSSLSAFELLVADSSTVIRPRNYQLDVPVLCFLKPSLQFYLLHLSFVFSLSQLGLKTLNDTKVLPTFLLQLFQKKQNFFWNTGKY
jgi:hypothetical protein